MIRLIFAGIFLLFSQLCMAQNQSAADSLLQLLPGKTDVEAAKIYNDLARYYVQTDTAKTLKYAGKVVQIAQKTQIPEELQKAYYYISDSYYYINDFPSSIKYLKEALKVNSSIPDSSFRADIYNSIGLSYQYNHNPEMAINYYLKGLKMCEKSNMESHIPYFYANIGMVHTETGNHWESIGYYRKALDINKKLGILPSIGVNLNGIGVAYYNLQQYDSAKYYYIRALSIFRKTKNEIREAILLNNIATIYINQRDSLSKALEYYKKSEEAFKRTGQVRNEASVLEGLGSLYREMGRYQEAIKCFEKCLQMAHDYKLNYDLFQQNFVDLALTYEQTGQLPLALKYQKLATQYADSVYNQEKMSAIAEQEKKYETEKQKAEIGRLRAEQELATVQLNKNRHLKIMGVISFILLMVALFYMTARYLERKRATQALEEKNARISKSEEELKNLNMAKNKFFSIIAHDLKNPFHTVMGYSQLLSSNFDSFSDEEKKKFAQNINQSANTIFRLLHNLLEWSRTQTNQIIFNPVFIDFNTVFTNATNYLQPVAEPKCIQIVPDYPGSTKVFADPLMLETVLRNLIGNAIKFSQSESSITVTIDQNMQETTVGIKDQGTGILPEDQKNLFQIDSKVKRKGTNNEEGSGLGLILCKELVEKHGGKIWVESEPMNGSTFYFTLPHQSLQPTSEA